MARKAKYGPYNYERTLGTRDYNMAADVSDFVKETELRLETLALSATQELIKIVQTPVGAGGKMRVDTGFLRASGQVSLTGMPTGETRGRKRTEDEKDGSVIYKPPTVSLKDFALGTTIYFGWTASYAIYREAYDGFLISGIQQWQSIVDRWCVKIEKRVTDRRKPKT